MIEFNLKNVLFVLLAIVIGVLIAVGLIMLATDTEGAEPDLYSGVPRDAKLLVLDKAALDSAYSQHLIKLWNVWLTDGAKEAHRITNGLRISRAAYHQAAEQIAKREKELEKHQ